MAPSLCDAQKQARNCGLDIPKLEALLAEIEPLSEKYKIILIYMKVIVWELLP